MSWEYRVVRERETRLHEWYYTIREVYTDGGYTVDGQHAAGASLEELKADYDLQSEAFKKPTLEVRDGKLVEVSDG